MYIKKDYSFNELEDEVWQEAEDTVKTVREAGKEEELMSYLEEIFEGENPTMTEINDLLRYEPEMIYDALDIPYDEDEEEE